MISKTFRIPYKYGQTITIKPLFDAHLGNEYCDRHALKRYLGEPEEGKYVFVGGDLNDSICVTDPRYEKHSDGTGGRNDVIDAQVDMAEDILKPFNGSLIGLGMGNHEHTIIKKSGTNPTKRLARRLGTSELGYDGFIKLVLSEGKSRTRTVIIRWHHGYGGGRTPGASINRYIKESYNWEADVYLFGHDHQLDARAFPRLAMRGNQCVTKEWFVGVCGSFLKTLSDGADPTYSEKAGYFPVLLGGLDLKIRPNRSGVDMRLERN